MLHLLKFFILGLEEFEEKIDRLGEEEESKAEEQSWIADLLKQLEQVKEDVEKEIEIENDAAANDMQDIEPPMLDTKWSLGLNNGGMVNRYFD